MDLEAGEPDLAVDLRQSPALPGPGLVSADICLCDGLQGETNKAVVPRTEPLRV